MRKILFQDNHIHSTYSDGQKTIREILEYNNIHDKVDITLTDHVDKKTNWLDKYKREIEKFRKEYTNFSIAIGCEVKILDNGKLNTTKKILDSVEVVLGSVHYFENIKSLAPRQILDREYDPTKKLAANKDIQILSGIKRQNLSRI